MTRTFGTLREAKAEYAHITHRRYEPATAPFDVRTLDERLVEWLARKAEDLEESTVYSYTMTLGRLRGMLGHIRLQDLAEDDVEAWMKWALVRGGCEVARRVRGWRWPRSRCRWRG
ncbi:hypothetical protein [Streptomyces sp. NBC_00236]|uniref:hypothetical protein n=1 Tax=Streptomyces sp. NBC_00236 TaxID=2903639 RepID=UPI002E2E3E1A|nr:hypothetical protein [Streptomyces sp. NBC_00236]